MTPSRTTTHTTTFLAALVAATIVLSGCATTIGAAPSPSASASDEATATSTAGATVTGTGATGWPGLNSPIPAGARSVSIDFTCEGIGHYVVEFGDAMAENTSPISGTCGAPATLAWPVDAKTQPSIAVTVDDGVAWTATPLFSTTEFVRDAAVTATAPPSSTSIAPSSTPIRGTPSTRRSTPRPGRRGSPRHHPRSLPSQPPPRRA